MISFAPHPVPVKVVLYTETLLKSTPSPGSTSFSVLANKFGYSVVREVILSNIREFYPDIPAHNISKHRERVAHRRQRRRPEL